MKFPIRVKVYVGPTLVQHFAERARQIGFSGVIEGTEHVIAEVPHEQTTLMTPTDRLSLQQSIVDRLYGSTMWGAWRDVEILSLNLY